MSGDPPNIPSDETPTPAASPVVDDFAAAKEGAMKGPKPAPRRFWVPLCILVFVISAVLLFWQLGHYPFWGDEADTALYARGIARTGDTYAVFDHNIYAWRNGKFLKNLRGRYAPPLSFYFAAPFVGANGTGTFWPRFPFAVCGLLSVVLMLYWTARSQPSALTWTVFSLGLLGNVSFFLYCRQCRYYALATLLSLLIVYLYLNWNGRWWKLTTISLASVLLLWTHYLPYAGLYAALACDYLVAQRRVHPLRWNHWLLLLGPQLLAGIWAVAIYNPVGAGVVEEVSGRNILLDKLILLWWNLRDLNACEWGVALLMVAAPVLCLLEPNRWLLRAPLAILSYIVIVTILSPQPVGSTKLADIRYLEALIPLFIFLTSLVIIVLARHTWFAIPLAVLVFGTNILNVPWQPHHWHSSIYLWIVELKTARITSAQQTIDWINENVESGQSIWVWPNYIAYPLMYYAPQALYGWQLDLPPEGQFKDLPLIQFVGGDPPDYIFAFGRQKEVGQGLDFLRKHRNIEYDVVSTIHTYWDDMTRPELFWRSFKPKDDYKTDIEEVYILRRHGLKASGP